MCISSDSNRGDSRGPPGTFADLSPNRLFHRRRTDGVRFQQGPGAFGDCTAVYPLIGLFRRQPPTHSLCATSSSAYRMGQEKWHPDGVGEPARTNRGVFSGRMSLTNARSWAECSSPRAVAHRIARAEMARSSAFATTLVRISAYPESFRLIGSVRSAYVDAEFLRPAARGAGPRFFATRR